MALSGTMYENVGSHWRLSISWTATQDLVANESYVTAKMYWESLDSYSTVSSSATKSSGIQRNGGTFSVESGAFASLSPNQKRLINTYSFTISHDSDGTASFTLDGYFDLEVTLSGTYYGRVSMDEQRFTLNTIARASTLESSASWVAGGNLGISIARASSSFTHDVRIEVNGVLIQTITGIGSSYTWVPSSGDQEGIFRELAKDTTSWNQSSKITLTTKKSGDTIGTKTYTGTVSSPSASTLSASDFVIGSKPELTISQKDGDFVHNLSVTANSYSANLATGTGSSTYDWDTSVSAVKTALYNATPNSNKMAVTYTLTTFYGSTRVRNPTTKTVYATVTNSNPTFGTSYTFKDINSKVTGVTGASGSTIVQGLSNLQIEIPLTSKAVAVNGATIKSYVATVAGISKTANYSTTGTVLINGIYIQTSGNVVLTVKAVDSRGNSATTTKTVTVVPYAPPKLKFSALRNNSFDADTVIKQSGSISSVNKLNGLKTYTYNYKIGSTGAWLASEQPYDPATLDPVAFTFAIPDKTVTLDKTKTFVLRLTVKDRFDVVSTMEITLSSGVPLLFIDPVRKSIGVGKFPTLSGALEIDGLMKAGTVQSGIIQAGGVKLTAEPDENTSPITLPASRYYGDGGGLDMSNSDIIGANSIVFNDSADGAGEGLLFLKDGKPAKSKTFSDYDVFKVRNGLALVNENTILSEADVQIQTGYVTITPKPNQATELIVKFPKAFSGTPRVMVSPNTTIPGYHTSGTWVSGVSSAGVSSTQFSCFITRTNDTATGVAWLAVWGGSR